MLLPHPSTPTAQVAPTEAQLSPGPGVAAELVHVWVVLGQDGDSVTILPDDEPGLLLRGTPQVYAIELGNTQSRLSDMAGAADLGSIAFLKEEEEGQMECRGRAPLTSSNWSPYSRPAW